MSETNQKVCVLCGRSCAGQPRIKNQKGEYAHQACVEARKKGPATAGVAPDADPGDDEIVMGALLDGAVPLEPVGEPSRAGGGLRAGCPGCGMSLAPGAVVCTGCGFDTRSGKARKMKVGKVKVGKEKPGGGGRLGEMAAGAGSAAASGMTFLLWSGVGACIGGAIGGAMWAGLIVGLGVEMRWIAIITGVLCGFGAVMGARGESSILTGLVATLACVVAICAGKYYGVKHLTDKALAEMAGPGSSYVDEMTIPEREDLAMSRFVDDILGERLAAGGLDEDTETEYRSLIESGVFLDEYPDDVVREARRRWRQMDDGAKAAFLDEQRAAFAEEIEVYRPVLYEEGFLATFGARDVFFFLSAIAAAGFIGTGAGMD